MKTFFVTAAIAATMGPVAALAETLLIADLSTANQITITATSGLSAISATGNDFIGVYFQSFHSGLSTFLNETLVSGNLTSAENNSNGSPQLFMILSDPGLNIFDFDNDFTTTFTASALAFTGSATWSLDSDDYAELIAGPTSGSLFFPADDAGDVAGLTALGEWSKIVPSAVPLPAGIMLLGSAFAGLGLMRRRNRSA